MGDVLNNSLTTKDKWEAVWAGAAIPAIQKPVRDLHMQLNKYLPHTGMHSLIEIGCAPGGWLAYFNKCFGYRVAGIEYAELAGETTKVNMKMLKIDASIFIQDFFSFDCINNKYDIVFSGGFIEHFKDMSLVMERICELSHRYVVTIVPNVFGINGWISKTLRPKIYAEHNLIDLPMLNRLHTNCGMQTLFCDYVGGIRLIDLVKGNGFLEKHKYCALTANLPTYIFNRLSEKIGALLHYIPRSKLFSDSLLYIGKKN